MIKVIIVKTKIKPKWKKIIIRRQKSQEERYVHLWYADRSWNFIISVVGQSGDIRMRMSTPKKNTEAGYPFAARTEGDLPLIRKNELQYRKSAVRQLKRIGYNAKIDGKGIAVIVKRQSKRR